MNCVLAARCTAWPPATDPVNDTNRDPRIGDHARDVVVVGVQELEHAGGQACFGERLGVPPGDERRLLRHFQDDAVARHDCGNDRVHRRQVWIVPRRQHQHDAERLAADEAPEPFLGLDHDVGQRRLGDVDHVARAFLEPAPDLERALRDGPANLPAQLGADVVGPIHHPRGHPPANRRPLGQGHAFPSRSARRRRPRAPLRCRRPTAARTLRKPSRRPG